MTTDFRQIDTKKLTLDVPAPQQIQEFSISLLRPLPQGFGIGVYYTLPPFSQWQYVGHVSPHSPSAFFRAPWKAELLQAGVTALKLGISIESQAFLDNLPGSAVNEEALTMSSVKGIAQDLYNFLTSFGSASQAGYLKVPTDCIDKWLTKFAKKHQRNPYFWLKKR